MKKFIISFLVIIVVLIFLVLHYGVQIGNVTIGKQVELKTHQDKNFEESDFYKNNYSKNKLCVVNLWATWCVPCVGEIPELNEVKEIFKKDSISFLSLSIDNDSIKLIKFLSKDKFKFRDITLENLKYRTAILNTLEGRKKDEYISSQSVPITYLIKNKKVISKIDGTIDKDELIALIRKNK